MRVIPVIPIILVHDPASRDNRGFVDVQTEFDREPHSTILMEGKYNRVFIDAGFPLNLEMVVRNTPIDPDYFVIEHGGVSYGTVRSNLFVAATEENINDAYMVNKLLYKRREIDKGLSAIAERRVFITKDTFR